MRLVLYLHFANAASYLSCRGRMKSSGSHGTSLFLRYGGWMALIVFPTQVMSKLMYVRLLDIPHNYEVER